MEVQSQFIEMFKNLPVNGVIKDLTVGNIASVKKSYSKEDIINYIDISSIDNTTKTIVETSEHLVTKAPSRAQQCVQKGDILVSTVRPINRNIAVIEEDTSHLVASTGFCILRPQEGYKEYLLSIVLSDTYTEKMCDKANGGLYPAVNNSDVLNYGIHIPDEDTAKKVSALYQQSDKSKFVGFKSQFIEMFGERTTTPVGYYIKDSFPGDWGKEDLDGTGVKVIRTTNFTNFGKLNLSEVVTRSIEEHKIQKKQILKYDTILERSGGTADNPVGRVVLFEEDEQYLCNNFTQVLRFKDIDPRFAFYALFYFYQMNKTSIRSMGSKTTGIQNLNMSKYLEIGIPNADEDEQKQFVSIAEQADKSKLLHRKSIKYSKYSL